MIFNGLSSFELLVLWLFIDFYKFTRFYYLCCNLFAFYNFIAPSGVFYFYFGLLLDLNSSELFLYCSANFLEREILYLGKGSPGPVLISFLFELFVLDLEI